MNFKKGGLLERISKARPNEGVCETCGNLVKLGNTALACVVKNKFIIPRFLPYHGNCKCKDWKMKEDSKNETD